MPTPKFAFVPERQLGQDPKESGYRVTLMKNGILRFPSDVVNIYDLDGKYIRMFADIQRKAVGWSIIEGKTSLEDIDDARLVKKNVNGGAVISIGRMLKKLGMSKETEFKNLEVNKFKGMLQANDIHYVILEKKAEDAKEE